MDYKDASRMLDTARDRFAGKPLCNNTRLIDRGQHFAVRLHQTDVIELRPNGTYALYSGGWYTMTTADRIRSFGPFGYDPNGKRGDLYARRNAWIMTATNGETVAFYEGIEVNSRGFVLRRCLKRARAELASWREEWREEDRVKREARKERDRELRLIRKRREAAAKEWRELYNVQATAAAIDWLADNELVPNTDGTVTLVKAVGTDYRSGYGMEYRPGTTVTADDYDAVQACGAGLHFGPTRDVSRRYVNAGPHGSPTNEVRYLACRVPVETLVPLQDKCKARSCYVERELDA